jgi:hypothetical protein
MTTLLQEAQARLAAQAAGAPPPAGVMGQTRMPRPEQEMYGIFSPQYATALAQQDDPRMGADALDRLTLQLQARGERQDYREDLQRAQEATLRGERQAGYTDLQGRLISVLPQLVTAGAGGTYGVIMGQDGAQLQADPISEMVTRNSHLNEQFSTTRKNNAAAVHDLYESGIQPDPNVVSGYMTSPTQAAPDPYGVFNPETGYNPSDQTAMDELPIKQLQAEAAMVAANAAATRAANPRPDTVVVSDQVFDPETGTVRTIRRTDANGDGSIPAGPSGGGGAPSGLTAQQQAIITRGGDGITVVGRDANGGVVIRNRQGRTATINRQGQMSAGGQASGGATGE